MDDLVNCPYCGEAIEITFDEGGGAAQDYIEDCQVCCRPIAVVAGTSEDGETFLRVSRLDD